MLKSTKWLIGKEPGNVLPFSSINRIVRGEWAAATLKHFGYERESPLST